MREEIYENNIAEIRALGQHLINKANTLSSEYRVCDFGLESLISDLKKVKMINDTLLTKVIDRLVELDNKLEPVEEPVEAKTKPTEPVSEASATEVVESDPEKEEEDVVEIKDPNSSGLDDLDYEEQMNTGFDDDII